MPQVDERLWVGVDLSLTPRCQSQGHDPDYWDPCFGDAEFWIVVPCGHGGLRCAERVRIIRVSDSLFCWCGASYGPSEIGVHVL